MKDKETKPYKIVEDHSRPCGQSYYMLVCPFCGAKIQAYKWSLAGSGKKCSCGAYFDSRRAAKY